MEILELGTIISLLSFSISKKIRWRVTCRLQRSSPSLLPSCSDSSAKDSSLLPLCPACPCVPLCSTCWPPHLPHSSQGLLSWVLCLDQPSGSLCEARRHSPKGDTCTLQWSPLCRCWVNTCRAEFQRMHVVTKDLFHLCVLITKGVVVTLQWRNPADTSCRAVVTKYHKRGGLEQQKFISYSSAN